jgi:hypothetical protein
MMMRVGMPTEDLRRWNRGATRVRGRLDANADGGRLVDRVRTRLLMVGVGADEWVGARCES